MAVGVKRTYRDGPHPLPAGTNVLSRETALTNLRNALRTAAAAGAALLFLGTAAGQPPAGKTDKIEPPKTAAPAKTPAPVKIDPAVEAWVKILGEKMTDRHDAVRDSARAALVALGDDALPGLKKLADSDDGATATAAKRVIAHIEGRHRLEARARGPAGLGGPGMPPGPGGRGPRPGGFGGGVGSGNFGPIGGGGFNPGPGGAGGGSFGPNGGGGFNPGPGGGFNPGPGGFGPQPGNPQGPQGPGPGSFGPGGPRPGNQPGPQGHGNQSGFGGGSGFNPGGPGAGPQGPGMQRGPGPGPGGPPPGNRQNQPNTGGLGGGTGGGDRGPGNVGTGGQRGRGNPPQPEKIDPPKPQAPAGPARGGFGGGVASPGAMLGSMVQGLDLTDKQKAKVTELIAAAEKNLGEIMAKLREGTERPDRETMRASFQKWRDEFQKELKAILTDEQRQKLDEKAKERGPFGNPPPKKDD